METYWRDGLYGLSVNEICRRTGLSKPALYREFGGEDGLLDAVLERYCATEITPALTLLSSDLSYAEKTAAIIEAATASPTASQGCLLAKMRGAPERLGPLSKNRVDAMVGELRGAYEAMFITARDRGEVRGDVEARLAGQYLDTQTTTAISQMAAGEDPDQVRDQARIAFSALQA